MNDFFVCFQVFRPLRRRPDPSFKIIGLLLRCSSSSPPFHHHNLSFTASNRMDKLGPKVPGIPPRYSALPGMFSGNKSVVSLLAFGSRRCAARDKRGRRCRRPPSLFSDQKRAKTDRWWTEGLEQMASSHYADVDRPASFCHH